MKINGEKIDNNSSFEKQRSASPEQEAEPAIILTGERENDHIQVKVHGQLVRLDCVSLQTLVQLILRRAGAGAGYVAVHPGTIFRLRRSIDRAVGPGAGKALIVTGSRKEYRLSIPREDLARKVGATESFAELEALTIITRDHLTELKRVCRAL
jgi:hypothetical protein